jgi:hypothetical protein
MGLEEVACECYRAIRQRTARHTSSSRQVTRHAVRLNERARSGGQPLFLTPRHVSHLSGDDFRYVAHPTFFDI